MDDTPETAMLLHRGKLEQRCPDCGRTEAGGFYCSECTRPMGPADWYPNGSRPLGSRRPPAPVKGGRKRARAELDTEPLESRP